MPLYVFRCPEGHVVEEQRKVEDRAKPIYCERCLQTKNETVAMMLQPSVTSPTFPGAASWRS